MAAENGEHLTVVSVGPIDGVPRPAYPASANGIGELARVENGVMPVRVESPPIVINTGRRRGSTWGAIFGVTAVALTTAAVVRHDQIKGWITDHETARDFRDRVCRNVLNVTAGRAESFFDKASLYVGCFESPAAPEGTTATGVPLQTTVQASLAPGYSSPNYQNGTIIISTPPEIPKPGQEAQITTADGQLHAGDMFDNSTYLGTDAEPYLESSKPTLEGFKEFWDSVDTSNKNVFAEGLSVNGRTDSHITPVRLVLHWTGSSGGTITHNAQAMAGRRGTPDCGNSGCDVQMFLGHDGVEDGQLAIVSPSLDTKMQHIAYFNDDSLGVEIIGTPQSSNNTHPNFTEKQMQNLTYLEVGLHELFPTIPLEKAMEANGFKGIIGHAGMPNQKRSMEPGSGIVDLTLRNAALFYDQYEKEVAKVVERQVSGDFSQEQINQFENDVQSFVNGIPAITPEDAIRKLVNNMDGTLDEKYGPTKVPQDIAFKALILAGWDIKDIPMAYAVFNHESSWYFHSVSKSDLGLINGSTGERVLPIDSDGHVNVVGSFGICQENYGQNDTSKQDREPTKHLNDLVYTLTWCRGLHDGNGSFDSWGAFNNGSYKNSLPDAEAAFGLFLASNPTQPGEQITTTDQTPVDTAAPTGTLPKTVFIGDSLTFGMNQDKYLEQKLREISSSVVEDGLSSRRLVSAACKKDPSSKKCQDLLDGVRTVDLYADEVKDADRVTVALGTNDPYNDKVDEYSPDLEETLIHIVDIGGADGVVPETDIVEVYGSKPDLNLEGRSSQLPIVIERVETARPKAKGKFHIIKMAAFVTKALKDHEISLPDGVHAGDVTSWHTITDELVRQL